MRARLDQALFGYDRGHRLIASSKKLDREAQWVLRGVTDMKFGGRTHQCLTILPVPSLGSHAFIRTWPAGDGFRSGSVWSHVLLMPTAELTTAEDFRALNSEFRRPAARSDADLMSVRSAYAVALSLELVAGPEQTQGVSDDVLERLVTASYGSDEGAEVVTPEAGELDIAVLGLFGQQWPSLRRRFAVRTRFRQSAASIASFDVQVLERASGKLIPTRSAGAPWSAALASDLRHPDLALRSFVQHFGPAGVHGRSDMSALAEVFVAGSAGDTEQTMMVVQRCYPDEAAMSELKLALVGVAGSGASLLPGWPEDELVRLRALLAMEPTSVDYSELRVGFRVEDLIRGNHEVAGEVVAAVQWSNIDIRERHDIVVALARALDIRALVTMTMEHPGLTRELLELRSDAWTNSDLWRDSRIDHEILLDLVASAPRATRDDVFRGLLIAGLADAAREVVDKDPDTWWSVLDPEHASVLASNRRALRAAAQVLAAIGFDRLPDSRFKVTADDQLWVVLGATEPDDNIWRLADPSRWIGMAEEPDLRRPDIDSLMLAYLYVIAIAAGDVSGDRVLRQRAWTASFGGLHRALEGTGAPLGTEATLARLLPLGPTWDWCARLRQGMARTAAEDGWSDDQVHEVASAAGSFAHDVEARYRELAERHSQSLLDGLRDFFRL